MGVFKALLPWMGTTLLSHQVSVLREGGCNEILVVAGHRAEDIKSELNGQDVLIIENPLFEAGRVSSIKAGVSAASSESDAYVLLGVDQPRTSKIVLELVRSHCNKKSPITSPRFKGRGGHPVILSSCLRSELLSMSEVSNGLRAVFDSHRSRMNRVPIYDSLVCLDLNEYHEYEKAVEKYNPRLRN